MTHSQKLGLVVGVCIVLGVAGYAAFTYLKEKPPTFLIEILTKQKPPPPLPSGDIAPLTVPAGFTATIFARNVPGARVMVRDQKGTLLLSQTKEGKVVALPDVDNDGKADRTVTILEGLIQPHGIVVLCPDTGNASANQDACKLYVAETGTLKVYAYDADTYTAKFEETVSTFPTGSGHFTRTLLPHPDGNRLLISMGSSCNVCIEKDPRRATVQSFDLTTHALTTFASGLRNTVFMAINPVTGAIWGTENGRDVIGDNTPPDEINLIEEGKNYGWPLCYGNNVHDTDFDHALYEQSPCSQTTAPLIELQAHSAALGLAFIPEEGWPEDMRGDVLVAYHGSWNRAEPTGYKVVRINIASDGTRATSPAPVDFLSGFLAPGAKEDQSIGRPVGILAEPGGVVYVSDDRAGAIYRITLNEPAM